MATTINITDHAYDYIQSKLKNDNKTAFLLSIKKTGCSGFSYSPSLVRADDEQYQSHEHIKIKEVLVLIDPNWRDMLDHTTIDYVEENKLGVKQKQLIFINPKEKGRCGCGESFHAS